MGHRDGARRPQGSTPDPVRSVRISDAVWEKAKRRASYEGITPSRAVLLFMEGYGDGLIDLPRVQLAYSPPPTSNAGDAA